MISFKEYVANSSLIKRKGGGWKQNNSGVQGGPKAGKHQTTAADGVHVRHCHRNLFTDLSRTVNKQKPFNYSNHKSILLNITNVKYGTCVLE